MLPVAVLFVSCFASVAFGQAMEQPPEHPPKITPSSIADVRRAPQDESQKTQDFSAPAPARRDVSGDVEAKSEPDAMPKQMLRPASASARVPADMNRQIPAGEDVPAAAPAGRHQVDFNAAMPAGGHQINFNAEMPAGRNQVDFNAEMPDRTAGTKDPRYGAAADEPIEQFKPIAVAGGKIDYEAQLDAEHNKLRKEKAAADAVGFMDKARAAFHGDVLGTIMRRVLRPDFKPVPGYRPNWEDIGKRNGALDSGEMEMLDQATSPDHLDRLEWEMQYLREQRHKQYIGGSGAGLLAGFLARLPWLLGVGMVLRALLLSWRSGLVLRKTPMTAQQRTPQEAPPASFGYGEGREPVNPNPALNPTMPDIHGHPPVSAFTLGSLCVSFHESPRSIAQRLGMQSSKRFLLAARVFAPRARTDHEVYSLEVGITGELHFCCFGTSGDHDNLGDGGQLTSLSVFEAAVINAVCQSRGLAPAMAKRLTL